MKYNYLTKIDGVIKLVMSGTEMPKKILPTQDKVGLHNQFYESQFKEWLTASYKFDIADKDNEDLFKIIAFTGKDCSSFEIVEKQLKQGILIPSENVEITTKREEYKSAVLTNNSNHLKLYAYFIPPTLIEEGEETQDELTEFVNWVKENYSHVKGGYRHRGDFERQSKPDKLETLHGVFIINRKTK